MKRFFSCVALFAALCLFVQNARPDDGKKVPFFKPVPINKDLLKRKNAIDPKLLQKLYGNCVPVVLNDLAHMDNTFVIAFYDLSDEEMKNKAYDYTRAQFFRSEYDIPNKTDENFGFLENEPNAFYTRLGLFEIEPFKSNQKYFNVFYVNHSLDKSSNSYEFSDLFNWFSKECPFLSSSGFYFWNSHVLRHDSSPSPEYDTWGLEGLGTAFNHEIGHGFASLKDEYFTEMAKNNLPKEEALDWNSRIPNCDYNRPFTPEEYQTGKGYCQKWCKGVDLAAYSKYKAKRDLYDSCESKLITKGSLQSWLDFCTGQLDFSTKLNFYACDPPVDGVTVNDLCCGSYVTYIGDAFPGCVETKEEACNAIFKDSPNNGKFKTNVQNFCYNGSLYNVWDLNIGKDCSIGTGCYAGCGGFSKETYGPDADFGAFGDAFRPNAISIMGHGPFNNSGPDFVTKLHENDNELPTHGQYDIDVINKAIKRGEGEKCASDKGCQKWLYCSVTGPNTCQKCLDDKKSQFLIVKILQQGQTIYAKDLCSDTRNNCCSGYYCKTSGQLPVCSPY